MNTGKTSYQWIGIGRKFAVPKQGVVLKLLISPLISNLNKISSKPEYQPGTLPFFTCMVPSLDSCYNPIKKNVGVNFTKVS